MVEVSDCLWLGSEADAEALVSGGRLSKKLSLTHILSIMNQRPDWLAPEQQPQLSSTTTDVTHPASPYDDVMEQEEGPDPLAEDHGEVMTIESEPNGGSEPNGIRGSAASAVEESEEVKELDSAEDKADVMKSRFKSRFTMMFVEASDSPKTDLLHRFDECCKFINQGVEQGGGVLVHCVYGVSRSATVVLAYLMWKEGRSLQVLLKELLTKKPDIQPNAGFMEQLELWWAMRCRLDPNNKRYKDYRLKHMANTMDFKDVKCVEEEVKNAMSADPNTCTLTSTAYYRCRKCRRLLFTEESVLPHMEGEGEAAFKWHKRTHKTTQGPTPLQGAQPSLTSTACSSLFIEPVAWMEELLLGNTEGKIMCPKCGSRLGSFSWVGQQCSCGTWVNPSFQVHRNKVDETRTLLRRTPHHSAASTQVASSK